jgi:uroporphyrinogen decarboxylase
MDTMDGRTRVNTALSHRAPDKLPVDFFAVPEIWRQLVAELGAAGPEPGPDDLFDPRWERVLRALQVDCRVVSYDQFCSPPESALAPGSAVEWWDVPGRSTPARMWRQRPAGASPSRDVLGRAFRTVAVPRGVYEENVPVLESAQSISDLRGFPWPDPSWWDFSALPRMIAEMNAAGPCHVRYRAGSVFEIAWQLMGMDRFLMELAAGSDLPAYLMDCILDRLVEVERAALDAAGPLIDMVYFYDDVATQQSLMLSPEMWRSLIKPRHAQIISLARGRGKRVMYHSDGAIFPLLEELADLGVDAVTPVQTDVPGMEPVQLKRRFGARLSFHGGIDIITTLSRGTPDQVRREAEERRRVLGESGGYIMASCHHVQADAPLANVLALYDPGLRG